MNLLKVQVEEVVPTMMMRIVTQMTTLIMKIIMNMKVPVPVAETEIVTTNVNIPKMKTMTDRKISPILKTTNTTNTKKMTKRRKIGRLGSQQNQKWKIKLIQTLK